MGLRLCGFKSALRRSLLIAQNGNYILGSMALTGKSQQNRYS
ncbi:MAG: hypothetical protein WDA65_09560 [Christensenellales bacterium]